MRIEDALPANISVEQYERNLTRMAANRAREVHACDRARVRAALRGSFSALYEALRGL